MGEFRNSELKGAFGDSHARRGLRELYEQRSAAWHTLASLAPERATTLAACLQLRLPRPSSQEVAS